MYVKFKFAALPSGNASSVLTSDKSVRVVAIAFFRILFGSVSLSSSLFFPVASADKTLSFSFAPPPLVNTLARFASSYSTVNKYSSNNVFGSSGCEITNATDRKYPRSSASNTPFSIASSSRFDFAHFLSIFGTFNALLPPLVLLLFVCCFGSVKCVFASNIPVKSYVEKEDHARPQSQPGHHGEKEGEQEDEVSGEMLARSRREEEEETEQKREIQNPKSLSRFVPL